MKMKGKMRLLIIIITRSSFRRSLGLVKPIKKISLFERGTFSIYRGLLCGMCIAEIDVVY